MNKQYLWLRDNIFVDQLPDISHVPGEADGLLAIGGELNPALLLDAYGKGIFPWYGEGQPVMWWSPDPRCVLFPDEFKTSRSLKKSLRKNDLIITFDQAFAEVINACAEPRFKSPGTWITQAIIKNYQLLHGTGHGHSVECWFQGKLVGGLYGIAIGQIFFGESMFSRMTDTSKICFAHLIHLLKSRGCELIDCQVYSEHLQRLGAKAIPRSEFCNILNRSCDVVYGQSINDSPWPSHSNYVF